MIWVYGSLRSGEYNFKYCMGENPQLIGKGKLKGFGLYSLGSYPFIYPLKDSEVVVEGYEIEEANKIRIDNMESGAGYHVEEVTIILETGEKEKVEVYVADELYNNRGRVVSGDWVKRDEEGFN